MAKKKAKPVKRAHFTRLAEKLNHFLIEVYTLGGREYPTPSGMPSSIRVLGREFQITYHSRIYAQPVKTSRLRGIVIYGERLIVLDPLQTIHDLRETLYHEIGHVYLQNMQRRGGSLTKLTDAQVEEVCDLFAEGHYDQVAKS